MNFEVVVTGKGGTPAKNKTAARALIRELAQGYEREGWDKLCGNAQNGLYIFERDGERHGLIVRPHLI